MVWKLKGKKCYIRMWFGAVTCVTGTLDCMKHGTKRVSEFGPECLKEKEDMKQQAETAKREKQIGERKTIYEGW